MSNISWLRPVVWLTLLLLQVSAWVSLAGERSRLTCDGRREEAQCGAQCWRCQHMTHSDVLSRLPGHTSRTQQTSSKDILRFQVSSVLNYAATLVLAWVVYKTTPDQLCNLTCEKWRVEPRQQCLCHLLKGVHTGKNQADKDSDIWWRLQFMNWTITIRVPTMDRNRANNYLVGFLCLRG